MTDVYRIGVKIAATNGVSSVLRVIQADLFGLNKSIDLTKGKLAGLKLAVVGAMSAMAGIGLLDAYKGLADAGGKLLNQQQAMIANGTTQRDLALEMAAAYKMTAIAGSDMVQNLKLVADLRTVFGAKNLGEATALAPTMMKAGIAAGLLTGQDPEQAAYAIAMIEDRLGYTVNAKTGQMDPGRAAQMAQMIDAIISGTNNRVGTQDLLGFASQALASGKLLNQQGLIDMVPVIQAMGGQKAGTALTAFDKAFVGGVMTQRGSGWLERLGLLSPGSVHKGQSGYVQITPDSIGGSAEMNDPQKWANDYLMPALQKIVGPNGSVQDMLKVIMQSGLANTTVRFLSELIGNSVQNAKDVVNIQQAAGTDQYDAMMKSLAGATQNFKGALNSLWEVLGLPAAQWSVTALNGLAGSIRKLTDWVGANPAAAETLDAVLLGLGAALTVLGTAAVVTAIAGMVGTGGTLALVAGGIIGLATALDALANAFPSLFAKDPNAHNPAAHPHQHWVNTGRGGGYWQDDSGYTPPPAAANGHYVQQGARRVWVPGQAAPVQLTGTVMMDGKKVGNIIATGMAAPSSGPTGTNLRHTPSGSAAMQLQGAN